jgi:hypothetical protein
MKPFLLILLLILSSNLQAQLSEEELIAQANAMQTQATDEVIAEGRRLYRSEQATWYAGDLFAATLPEKSDDVGGYFSYEDSTGIKTIYYSNRANPTVIATILFDTMLDVKTAQVDTKERMLTPLEHQLYYLRLSTITDITSGNGFYRQYNNTNLNLVPMIDSTYKRVYVMTGLKQSCLVIFGNDYLVTFDDQNKIQTRQRIHKDIVPVTCTKGTELQGAYGAGTSHSHLPETGDLPTATDICTLLLYAKQANWKQHTIYSANNVCIWDCEANNLSVLTRDEWKAKISAPPPAAGNTSKTTKRK